MYRDCLASRSEEARTSWRSLIRFFLPLTEHLLRQYFSDVWPDQSEGAAALFAHLRANDGERLRAYTGLNEKEFLMFLRDELFALARARRGESEPLHMTHEQFAELLNQFLPTPREAAVMLAKGYAPEKFAVVLHMEDAAARDVQQKCNAALANWGLEVSLPANLDRLLAQLERQDTTPECVPVRTFVRIKDGQITWDAKEAADRHLAACLHCFQHYVTYQELHWFFLDCAPAGQERMEAVAARMGLAGEKPEKKPSLLARMFGGVES